MMVPFMPAPAKPESVPLMATWVGMGSSISTPLMFAGLVRPENMTCSATLTSPPGAMFSSGSITAVKYAVAVADPQVYVTGVVIACAELGCWVRHNANTANRSSATTTTACCRRPSASELSLMESPFLTAAAVDLDTLFPLRDRRAPGSSRAPASR